jgi:hypothetical protein
MTQITCLGKVARVLMWDGIRGYEKGFAENNGLNLRKICGD